MIISWNTTNQCNMRCAHCYREAGAKATGELNTDEAKQLLTEIAQAGFKIMIFSGGEPLLRPDILELVHFAATLKLRPVLGSNATLITREMAQALKDAGAVTVGISLDSMDPEKHDTLRAYPGGWQETLDGINHCREAGLPFQIHTTVMGWNKGEVEDLTDFAVTLGAKAHHIFFLVPTGRGVAIEQESLHAEEYEELLGQILTKQTQAPIEIKPTCAPQFMRIAQQQGVATRFTKGCLAGTAYCIVSPTGDVQPCAYLKISAGNIRSTPFDRIWRESPVFERLRTEQYGGACGQCGYQKICGGCRARAYHYHGDFMAEEPFCLFRNQAGEG